MLTDTIVCISNSIVFCMNILHILTLKEIRNHYFGEFVNPAYLKHYQILIEILNNPNVVIESVKEHCVFIRFLIFTKVYILFKTTFVTLVKRGQ